MTSASIMEMQKTGFIASANAQKTVQPNVGVQFSDAMEFASSGQKEDAAEPVSTSEVKSHAEKNAVQHSSRKEIRETEPVEAKEDVADEQIVEEVESREEAIVKEIAEELGVSEEEVVQAMEMLGLSLTDLLSQGNMAALTAELTGMQTVDVLTDENLFAQVTQLTENVKTQLQSVADDLGISLEQLQTVIEEQMAASTDETVPQMQTGVEGQEQTEVLSEEAKPLIQNEISSKDENAAIKLQQADEIPDEKVAVADSGKQTVSDENVVNESETMTEAVKSEGETGAGAQGQSGHETQQDTTNMQGNPNVQQSLNQVNEVSTAVPEEVFDKRFDLEQTREMIRQISDYVKVHHSEKVSSMEIQLHPVELGTVNLQVVAKDGNVSARLAVQDEAVRAAMESQIVQLRESLQEQGLKIDAVEVTVATHEFEQNLDQQGKEAEEQAAQQKKSARRILDLNEIGQGEELDEEMSDADRLQIEMMRMGGNRLNFRV